MDNYYLNLAVYLLEDFLEHRTNRHTPATSSTGGRRRGIGWQPTTNADLVRGNGRLRRESRARRRVDRGRGVTEAQSLKFSASSDNP
jgi:hypothetical protein